MKLAVFYVIVLASLFKNRRSLSIFPGITCSAFTLMFWFSYMQILMTPCSFFFPWVLILSLGLCELVCLGDSMHWTFCYILSSWIIWHGRFRSPILWNSLTRLFYISGIQPYCILILRLRKLEIKFFRSCYNFAHFSHLQLLIVRTSES